MAIDTKLFEYGVNRENTGCVKWDARKGVFGRADVIPLWVADMDFASPDCVAEAIIRRAQHGAFGYCTADPADKAAVISWMKTRHGVDVTEESIFFTPGVVDSTMVATAALGKPGDKVVIMPPVYPSFFGASTTRGLVQVRVPLLCDNNNWSMDYEGLEKAFRDGAKIVILCNPHNPVGRVWTEDELKKLVELTRRYGVTIVSDDIHADLILPGNELTSILKLEPRAIAMISATKTFNLAGLRHSSVIIPDPELRKLFEDELRSRAIDGVNMFGRIAQTAAYNGGAEWLDALLEYLDGTRAEVEKFLAEELPEVTCAPLQGTYLMWLDFKALGIASAELGKLITEKAGVGLCKGTDYGPEGEGYMRLNIASPRSMVMQGLRQIKAAIDEYRK